MVQIEGGAQHAMAERLSQKEHAQLASVYALMTRGPVLNGPEAGGVGGLKPRRAGSALTDLDFLGVVRKGAPQEVGWKRPSRAGSDPEWAYCLSNSWGYAVGVTVGHRGVGTGLIDARGGFSEHGTAEPECRVDGAVAVGDDYRQTLQAIAGQIFECVSRRRAQLQSLGSDTPVDIRAVTVGVPGQIKGIRLPDPRDRRVTGVLMKFSEKPVAADLATVLARSYKGKLPFDPREVPIWLENDADCAAVGELHWGEGIGCRSLLVVKVSAGVGAGIIVNGSLHYGHEATTGEIGHDPVHPALLEHLNQSCPAGLEPLHPDSDFLQCSCALAQSSHLEAYASATAVTCRVLGKRRRDIDLKGWRESLTEIINAAVVDGDEKAERAITDAGFLLGREINTLASALGPQRVLVIGPLADAEGLFLGAIQDEIETVEIPTTHAPRDVRFGARGEAARWIGVNGAARLALEQGVWGPARKVGHSEYEWLGYRAAEALVRAAKDKQRDTGQAAEGDAEPRAA